MNFSKNETIYMVKPDGIVLSGVDYVDHSTKEKIVVCEGQRFISSTGLGIDNPNRILKCNDKTYNALRQTFPMYRIPAVYNQDKSLKNAIQNVYDLDYIHALFPKMVSSEVKFRTVVGDSLAGTITLKSLPTKVLYCLNGKDFENFEEFKEKLSSFISTHQSVRERIVNHFKDNLFYFNKEGKADSENQYYILKDNFGNEIKIIHFSKRGNFIGDSINHLSSIDDLSIEFVENIIKEKNESMIKLYKQIIIGKFKLRIFDGSVGLKLRDLDDNFISLIEITDCYDEPFIIKNANGVTISFKTFKDLLGYLEKL